MYVGLFTHWNHSFQIWKPKFYSIFVGPLYIKSKTIALQSSQISLNPMSSAKNPFEKRQIKGQKRENPKRVKRSENIALQK